MQASPTDETTQRILREIRAGLSAVYGPRLRQVYLYGSYARGEQREGSDLDILVVLAEADDVGAELARMSDLGSRLSLAHDVTISFLPVSESEFATLQTPFLLNVRREAVTI